MALSCTRDLLVGYKEKFLFRKCGEVLKQVVQGGPGVMVPGCVQEKGRCGTKCHGLERSQEWVDGWTHYR